MTDLNGRVALITGASRGIGAATAKILAAHGASIAVNYMSSPDAADEVVRSITDGGGKALAVKADVRSAEDVTGMVNQVHDQMGEIDILVLNAGMNIPMKPFVELSYDEFRNKVMGEMDCFFWTLQAVLPGMIERKRGCVVGISSGLSRYASPRYSSHTTAKSAVDGLMKSLARELGPYNIRVNTIAPGLTETDATAGVPKDQVEMISRMTPLGRIAQPEDIAGAVLGVVSDDMGFVTGAYIPVSGGSLML